MTNEIPENWPGIVVAIFVILAWFMRLENRLTNKLDREKSESDRQDERKRVDAMFKDIYDRLDRRAEESSEFRQEIRNGLNDLSIQLARHGFGREKT